MLSLADSYQTNNTVFWLGYYTETPPSATYSLWSLNSHDIPWGVNNRSQQICPSCQCHLFSLSSAPVSLFLSICCGVTTFKRLLPHFRFSINRFLSHLVQFFQHLQGITKGLLAVELCCENQPLGMLQQYDPCPSFCPSSPIKTAHLSCPCGWPVLPACVRGIRCTAVEAAGGTLCSWWRYKQMSTYNTKGCDLITFCPPLQYRQDVMLV